LTWRELDDAIDRGSPENLLAGPDEALERVREHGDLFGPVLTCVQQLPAR
jgi:hypothetical protein